MPGTDGRKRQVLYDTDIVISGTAVTLDLPVSTVNQDHFSRIPNLKIMD